MEWVNLNNFFGIAGIVISVGTYLLSNKEARRIMQLNKIMIRGLEETGQVKFNKDANGEPIGVIVNLSGKGSAIGTSSAKATLSVSKAPSPES